MTTTNEKEESVSLSFSDQDDDGDAGNSGKKHGNHSRGFTITLTPVNDGKKKDTLGASVNRSKFMRAAPSLMRLLSIGKLGAANSAPTPKSKISTLSSLPDGKATDLSDSKTSDNNTNNNEDNNGDNAPSSVVNTLLSEYEKNTDFANQDDQIDMQLLAAQAAQEFETLASQNDELYREKEQFKQKYDDLNHEMEQLKQTLDDYESIKQQNQSLTTENLKYQSQIQIYQQEKEILQETIRNNNNNNNNTANNGDNNMYDNNNNSNTNTDGNNNNGDNEKLMVQISQITKEKNELEHALDEFRTNSKTDKDRINTLNEKLLNSENEINRLNDDLTKQQNQYIKLQQSKQDQSDKYNRQLSIHSEQILDEYKVKQQQLLKTIENQKKLINELQDENHELQQFKVTASTVKDKKFSMSRLRTQANLLNNGNQQYDDDPFGGDYDEDPFGGDANDDNYDDEHETFIHGDEAQESVEREETKDTQSEQQADNSKDLKNEEMDTNDTAKDEDDLGKGDFIMTTTQVVDYNERDIIIEQPSGGCGCFVSFFNKFKKNNGSKSDTASLVDTTSKSTTSSPQKLF